MTFLEFAEYWRANCPNGPIGVAGRHNQNVCTLTYAALNMGQGFFDVGNWDKAAASIGLDWMTGACIINAVDRRRVHYGEDRATIIACLDGTL